MLEDVKQVIGDSLQLGDRTAALSEDTPLLGSMPELDSMAVVAVSRFRHRPTSSSPLSKPARRRSRAVSSRIGRRPCEFRTRERPMFC